MAVFDSVEALYLLAKPEDIIAGDRGILTLGTVLSKPKRLSEGK